MAKQPVKTATRSESMSAKAAPPATSESAGDRIVGLRREMDRLFDNFLGGFPASPFARPGAGLEPFTPLGRFFGATTPAVDLVEKEKAFQLSAELPGMDEGDIDVTLSNDMLTIKGEKKEEHEEKEEGRYLSERRYGSFERAFRMPDGVDRDKIDAQFDKGILTLTLPKTKEAQKRSRKIAVKAK